MQQLRNNGDGKMISSPEAAEILANYGDRSLIKNLIQEQLMSGNINDAKKNSFLIDHGEMCIMASHCIEEHAKHADSKNILAIKSAFPMPEVSFKHAIKCGIYRSLNSKDVSCMFAGLGFLMSPTIQENFSAQELQEFRPKVLETIGRLAKSRHEGGDARLVELIGELNLRSKLEFSQTERQRIRLLLENDVDTLANCKAKHLMHEIQILSAAKAITMLGYPTASSKHYQRKAYVGIELLLSNPETGLEYALENLPLIMRAFDVPNQQIKAMIKQSIETSRDISHANIVLNGTDSLKSNFSFTDHEIKSMLINNLILSLDYPFMPTYSKLSEAARVCPQLNLDEYEMRQIKNKVIDVCTELFLEKSQFSQDHIAHTILAIKGPFQLSEEEIRAILEKGVQLLSQNGNIALASDIASTFMTREELEGLVQTAHR